MIWSELTAEPWRLAGQRDTIEMLWKACEDERYIEYIPGNHWRARVLSSAEIVRWIEAFLEFNRAHGTQSEAGWATSVCTLFDLGYLSI